MSILLSNILPGILVTTNAYDIQKRFVFCPDLERLCTAAVLTLCSDLRRFSHDTEKSLRSHLDCLVLQVLIKTIYEESIMKENELQFR